MATREQVKALVGAGMSYAAAAERLGIPAGRAYMIATGAPADGSSGHAAQELVNPRHHNPTRDERVVEWVRARAARELR